MKVLRPHGNNIKMEQVLIVLLLVVLVPAMLYIFRHENIDYYDFGDDGESLQPIEMVYPEGDRPVNNIGQQRSSEKERQNRQLNQRMFQFLELRKVE